MDATSQGRSQLDSWEYPGIPNKFINTLDIYQMHTCVYILYYIKERFSSKSAAQSFIPTPDTLLFEGEQVYVLMTVSMLVS